MQRCARVCFTVLSELMVHILFSMPLPTMSLGQFEITTWKPANTKNLSSPSPPEGSVIEHFMAYHWLYYAHLPLVGNKKAAEE